MSAGRHGEYPGEPPIDVVHSLDVLAPQFRAAVEKLIADCEADGMDPIVHESYRSRETAQVYYARGRTTIPPNGTVTNAPNETFSWHGYGLAVDIISKADGWDAGGKWFLRMGHIAEQSGLKWGGRWPGKKADQPHVQWGKCKDSPSDEARRILADDGMEAVWTAVGAA